MNGQDQIREENEREERELARRLERCGVTDEWLRVLVEASRTIGWDAGDYWETMAFVQACFQGRDKKPSYDDLAPYEPPEK